MKLFEMIEADKLINRFMGNRTITDVCYWNSWDNLMKVTEKIFKQYEKNPSKKKCCEMLRYALYWNRFDHVYEETIRTINYFYGTKP